MGFGGRASKINRIWVRWHETLRLVGISKSKCRLSKHTPSIFVETQSLLASNFQLQKTTPSLFFDSQSITAITLFDKQSKPSSNLSSLKASHQNIFNAYRQHPKFQTDRHQGSKRRKDKFTKYEPSEGSETKAIVGRLIDESVEDSEFID